MMEKDEPRGVKREIDQSSPVGASSEKRIKNHGEEQDKPFVARRVDLLKQEETDSISEAGPDYASEDEEEGEIQLAPQAPQHPTQAFSRQNSPFPGNRTLGQMDVPLGDQEDGEVTEEVKEPADNVFSQGNEAPKASDSSAALNGEHSQFLQSPLTFADTAKRTVMPTFAGCSPFTDYESEQKIGEGTFGVVSKGIHKATRDKVALKKILVLNDKEGTPITALREIKILKSLKHPNIVSMREIAYQQGDRKSRTRGVIYMVFPYMDHDLYGLLENPKVRLSPSQVKCFIQQVLLGIEHLHKNRIVHRDMKSANILIDNEGHLKLADFGLARTLAEEGAAKNGYTTMVVTRWYRPPELLLGEKNYGPAIDIWGVGCVFADLLKRKALFQGSSELDQLSKIFDLCGTPNENSWPEHKNLPEMLKNNDLIGGFAPKPRMLQKKFPSEHYNPVTVQLLDDLLTLNPAKRVTASQALNHRYFNIHPAPAKPGTKDFDTIYPPSHELEFRNATIEGQKRASALGTAYQRELLLAHYDSEKYLKNYDIKRR